MISGEDWFIVHYDSSPVMVTLDRKQAERELAIQRKKSPALEWKISEGLRAFGFECYRRGSEAAEEEAATNY